MKNSDLIVNATIRNLSKEYSLNKDNYSMEIECNKLNMDTEINKIKHTLLKIIKAKDSELYKHSVNVSNYSILVGQSLGLNDTCLYNIKFAGLFHDIGKIAIKDNILNKPSNLNEGEFMEMKRHTCIGYKILNEFSFLKDISEIVIQHHEMLNGKGYPFGLTAEAIKIESKIITVCDTFDALTSERVYKAGYDIPKALKILNDNKNTLYDATVVETLSNNINDILKIKNSEPMSGGYVR